jgi:DNA-binding FadR family transcriptional regulator
VLTPRHPALTDVPKEHILVLAALQSGDPDRLGEVLREHIIGTSSILMHVRSH